jgi:hypothetical protein
VDNFLPCKALSKEAAKSKGGRSNAFQSLVYSKAEHSQLWVPLLEKAYAKAHG